MSSSNPQISIVIPAYNYARYLKACIDSVLAQTYPHWELIVIDNGSTDETPEVLATYDDPRIRKSKIEVNEGPVKAWAMGYELCEGDYFALLPADDMFTPHKLEKQVAYLREHPDVHCLATYIEVVDDAGQPTDKDHGMRAAVNIPIDFTDLAEWRWKHHFCIPTALYNRDMCERAGKIPLDGLTNICDWDFHVRLLGAGAKFEVLPECLTLYRWHQSNTSLQMRNTHHQWIYGHTSTYLPVVRDLAPDAYLDEIGECIEQIYLTRQPHYFLEKTPEAWRRAHLEVLLDPRGGLEGVANFQQFQQRCEDWQVDNERRAAIAALDRILMGLRGTLLKEGRKSELRATTDMFPLERHLKEIYGVLGWPLGGFVYFLCKVKRELRRVVRRIRAWYRPSIQLIRP